MIGPILATICKVPRVNPTETAINSSNISTLAVKWKSPFPVTYRVRLAYNCERHCVCRHDTGFLIAFDITNGNTLWTFAAKGPIYGSPTVANGIVYFGTVNYPAGWLIGNYVYALNATDGSLIWENYLDKGADWVKRQQNRSRLPPTWTKDELGKRSAIERFFGRVFLFFH